MPNKSAGLLMFRRSSGALEVFLVHPGGPFWVRKDAAAWSIPKGEYSPGEDPLDAAKREFHEETGFEAVGEMIELKVIKQPGGKLVRAWAFEGDCDARAIRSNLFSIEWPPRSGKTREFPEVDRAEWFGFEIAKGKILNGQLPLLEELQHRLKLKGR